MKQRTRQKIQLIINIVLTVFSLTALIISMVAWFSNSRYAEIRSLEMKVERKEIVLVRQPQSYLFPCATKIGDVTKEDFNGFCCVTGTYEIQGKGQLYANVTNNDGVLGYVLDGSEGTDYFTAISTQLQEKLGSDWKSKSYSELRKALKEINLSRPVGNTNSDGNTEITIVCWTQYDKFDSELNILNNGIYTYNEIQDLKVKITFVI